MVRSFHFHGLSDSRQPILISFRSTSAFSLILLIMRVGHWKYNWCLWPLRESRASGSLLFIYIITFTLSIIRIAIILLWSLFDSRLSFLVTILCSILFRRGFMIRPVRMTGRNKHSSLPPDMLSVSMAISRLYCHWGKRPLSIYNFTGNQMLTLLPKMNNGRLRIWHASAFETYCSRDKSFHLSECHFGLAVISAREDIAITAPRATMLIDAIYFNAWQFIIRLLVIFGAASMSVSGYYFFRQLILVLGRPASASRRLDKIEEAYRAGLRASCIIASGWYLYFLKLTYAIGGASTEVSENNVGHYFKMLDFDDYRVGSDAETGNMLLLHLSNMLYFIYIFTLIARARRRARFYS